MKRLFVVAALAVVAVSAAAQSRAERILREIRDPQSNYVAVIAHRGDWRNFPENSLEAYESAIRMGVDMVEVDVHRTADGVLVVCHDKTINRTTSGKGKIAEITYDSISRCCLRSGHGVKMPKYHVPTLAEVLDLCRDRVLINIDKGYDYYDEILPMLIERNMVGQVVIKSKRPAETVENRYAGYQHNMHYIPIINYNAKMWDRHKPLFERWLSSSLRPMAYEVCWDGTLRGERKIFRKVIDSGVKLWVNTFWGSVCGGEEKGLEDDKAFYEPEKIYSEVLATGATMIQCDRPALLIDYLTAHGRHTLR